MYNVQYQQIKIMKNYRITYRQEVVIQAESEDQANEIFSNLNLQDLENELGNGIIKRAEYIEEVSLEEE
jgi:hypothetical protein